MDLKRRLEILASRCDAWSVYELQVINQILTMQIGEKELGKRVHTPCMYLWGVKPRGLCIAMFGPLSDDICVCHKCDNGKCVRPDHWFLGTQKENLEDAALKGRLRASGQGRCKVKRKRGANRKSKMFEQWQSRESATSRVQQLKFMPFDEVAQVVEELYSLYGTTQAALLLGMRRAEVTWIRKQTKNVFE